MDFSAIGMELGLLALALLFLAMGVLLPKKESRTSLATISVVALLALFAYGFSFYRGGEAASFYAGLYVADNYAVFFKQLFLLSAALVVLFSGDYVERLLRSRAEFYAILVFAVLGMCVMASANDFLTLYIGLELMTISFYVFVGLRQRDALSSEAAIKYLVLGAAASAILFFGVSLIYGAAGSLRFAAVVSSPQLFTPLGIVGMALVFAGIFFKLSMIPFHMWAPDVYEGAPAPVAALLAMGSKAAAFAVLLRLVLAVFPPLGGMWFSLLAILAAVSMVGGNVMAIVQDDVKRMLAYSSIAQVGYMLVGVVAADAAGMKALLFYLALYAFANIGAFAVLTAVEAQRGKPDMANVAGLARTAPVLAAVMTISLLSMAGIPPTAGFAGKLYLFTAVVDQGGLWLAFVGFIMSMISVYYYLLVVKAMYLGEGPKEPVKISGALRACVLVSVALTLALGVYPEPLANLTNFVAATFF